MFKKGFSLVELLVVITIIAILSVVAYTAVGGQTVKARDSKRKQDLNTIQSAMELFFIDKNRYPDETANVYTVNNTAKSYQIIDETDVPKKFLSQVPIDPRKADDDDGDPVNQDLPYSYKYDSVNKAYQLAATFEDENGQMTAYVVGNSDTDLIGGVTAAGADCPTVTNGSTTCFPYIFD